MSERRGVRYQTVPANQQFVDVTNAGFASIDVNACSFAGFNVLTETTIGAATVALSGTLAPGEIFRIGSAGVSGVDAVIADGALPAGPGGLSLLDAAPPADGTSVGAEFPDNITGIVYIDNETIFGVAHLRVPAHNAIYDCIYGGGAGASFDASNSTLVVTGDGLDNNIEVSRDGVGNILVNGGATPISGGTPTVANTNLIVVCGQNGNDTISLNEVSGALPQAQLRGGVGNDTLIGGSGNDVILGESGNDLARGGDGEDNARDGTGNDTLLGDRGNDSVFGDDGSDLVEGGSGTGTDT